jgi:hypothetical protein
MNLFSMSPTRSMINRSYYLTWRNYQSLKLSAFVVEVRIEPRVPLGLNSPTLFTTYSYPSRYQNAI